MFLWERRMRSARNKELLFSVTKNDLKIQTFRAGGKGGQHQNKVETGVRLIHRESGAVGESRSERSQHRNRIMAFRRLVASPKFKLWISRKTYEILQKKTIEEIVDEQMNDINLKIEIMKNGKWIGEKNENI